MKKKLIWIGLIALIVVIAIYSFTAGKKPMAVDMGVVEKGNINKYIEEEAIVQLTNETSIYATEGGKVIETIAEVGQEVKTGDVLLRMDAQASELQIKALEAEKQSLLAQYSAAKEPANASELRTLNAKVKSAEAIYEDAKRNVENNKELYESGAISYDAYQISLSALTTAEASLEAARSSLETGQNGVSSNIRKQYEAKISGIQANIDLLQKKRAELNIVSPINGTVLTRGIEKGGIIQPSQLVFEIGDKSGIYLISDILVDDIANVKEGAAVLIENEDLGIKDIKGTVRKVHPKAFSKISDLGIEQKRVKVEIDFNESVSNLKSGYDMTVKIITANKENTLLLDEKAVFEYQGKYHVFVNENGTAKLRAIEKGLESDDRVEILSGLIEGDKVILSPDEKLTEGTKIK